MPIPPGIYPPFAAFELWSGRDGDFDSLGIRNYTRVFGVFTDDPLRGPLTVWLVTGLPRYGDFYVSGTDFDRAATLRKIHPQQDEENPMFWRLVCHYSNEPRSRKWPQTPKKPNDSSDDKDPTLRPTITKFKTVTYDVPFGVDDPNGKWPVVNSAGDPILPAPVRAMAYLQISYTRNVLTINPGKILTYLNKLNAVKFNGYEVKCVKFADWDADQRWENETLFWTEHYEFQARPQNAAQVFAGLSPWRLWLVDMGMHQIDPNGNRAVIKGLNDAIPVSQPVPLDGAGKAAVPGALLKMIKDATDGQSGVNTYEFADLNELKITFGN